MATLATKPAIDWPQIAMRHWLLLAGLVAVVLPTLVALARGPWSMESGVHGPIVLATGLWLIGRRLPEIRTRMVPGSIAIALAMLGVGIPAYAFGRAFDFISIEAAALGVMLVAAAYAFVGGAVIRLMWFPIFYMGFIVPIPGWVLDKITQPLKIFVSEAVVWALTPLGYPIARIGVTIYVASYQLLVEDACAGLNSLVSLSSIGLFYVYIMRNSNWRYSMLLLALLLPIAVAANVVRVIALVLITYHFGDAAAQGYLHKFAGMVTFTSALLLIFLIDSLLKPVRDWLARDGGGWE